MKKKNMIIMGVFILSIGIIIGVAANSLRNTQNNNVTDKGAELTDADHEESVSGYFFKTTKKSVIEKEFDGEYLNSFVTVAEPQDEFLINIKGVSEGIEVYMINPTNGDMMPMEYKDGIFSIKTALNKDINYGIIMDYKLVGSVRVVEDLAKMDQDKLFRDILVGLGCAL